MKENNYQEKKNDITFYQSVKKSIKNNHKIIILILLILILVIIITNISINKYYNHCLNKNIKSGGSQMSNVITSKGLGIYSSIVSSKCTSGAFIASAERFNAIMDNLTYVIVLILAIVIIPAFPVVFYIGIIYAIIYNLIGNIIKS